MAAPVEDFGLEGSMSENELPNRLDTMDQTGVGRTLSVKTVLGLDTPWGERYRVIITELLVHIESGDGMFTLHGFNEDPHWARMMGTILVLDRIFDKVSQLRTFTRLNDLIGRDGLAIHDLTVVCSGCGKQISAPVLCEERDIVDLAADPRHATHRLFTEEGWNVDDDGSYCPDCSIERGLIEPDFLDEFYEWIGRGEDDASDPDALSARGTDEEDPD